MVAAARTSWTAEELLATVFPEPRWAVPGLLPEGLTLLVGSPKVGKSWAALGVAVAVASGGRAFGEVPVAPGDVLYLGLEDTPRRLQRRIRAVLGASPPPARLTVSVACPPIGEGGAEKISDWLAAHPEARLVVLDVLARVRSRAPATGTQYDADYTAVAAIKSVADRFGVAFLVVHHTRKAAADDFLDVISGTQGLAGAADAILLLRRARGSADATLHLTGRDVEEAEHALRFDAETGSWNILEGPASDYTVSDSRAAVLRHLRAEGPTGPKEIALALGLSRDNVRQLLHRMITDGQLVTDSAGRYTAPPVTPPVTDSDRCHTSQVSQRHRPSRSNSAEEGSSLISLFQSQTESRDTCDTCDTPHQPACAVCGEPLDAAVAAGGFQTHPGCE